MLICTIFVGVGEIQFPYKTTYSCIIFDCYFHPSHKYNLCKFYVSNLYVIVCMEYEIRISVLTLYELKI